MVRKPEDCSACIKLSVAACPCLCIGAQDLAQSRCPLLFRGSLSRLFKVDVYCALGESLQWLTGRVRVHVLVLGSGFF